MVKLIVMVWRRPDFTPEQFLSRWKNEHAALVTRHSKVLRMRRYVQSHAIASRAIDSFTGGRGWGRPCDGITEIWWDSEQDLDAGFSSPEGQEASADLQRDEAIFVEMSKVTAFLSREHTVFDKFAAQGSSNVS